MPTPQLSLTIDYFARMGPLTKPPNRSKSTGLSRSLLLGDAGADYSGSLMPRCRHAAISVLLSSSAMVMGPTPPGTGVIAPALG